MRRELRRHPVQGKQKPARTARPSRATAASGPGTGQRSVAPTRSPLPAGGLRGLLRPQWFRDVMSELRKVTWPTRQETTNLTIVVVVVAAALGLFLGGLDYGFNWLLERTLLR
ncbi:MAG: preprotein translocase subunit SecE [Dehalococcoidia bacterium]